MSCLLFLQKEHGLQVELTDQRRKLEKNKNKHLELENSVMTQMLQKLMDNKAAQYYQRLTNKKASLKKEKVNRVSQEHLSLESRVSHPSLTILCLQHPVVAIARYKVQ